MAPGRNHQGSGDPRAKAPAEAVAGRTGMRIEHERPAPETEPHVIAPLILTLPDGRRLTARKWSLAGIRDSVLAGQDLTDARLVIPFQGIEVGFPVRLTPSADGGFWAFEGLTGRQREALGLFYRNLMTGKMAATDEVITALDTPVDLIPMGETEEERSAGKARVRPRALRILYKVLYYTVLFGVVAGYLGSLVWNRLDHLALTNARYVAPFDQMAAPANGFVAEILVPVGAPVAAGDLLVRLSNPDAAAALADVRGAVSIAEARLAAAQARLASHMRRQESERLRATDPDAFDAGLSLLPGDFHDVRQRLEQEAWVIELELRALRSERGRLREAEEALELRAPAAGRIERVLVPPGSFQRAGTPLVTFEADVPRSVIGWLDSAEAGHVWQGMKATIYYSVAGERQSVPAWVSRVEAGADPLRPDTYGLMVHLELEGLDLEQSRLLLPHNIPVEVQLHRDLARRWLGLAS